MAAFIIILVLALVTWYIIKAQATISNKKLNRVIQAPSVSKDAFLQGLDIADVSQPLLSHLVQELSRHIYGSAALINTALIALLSKWHIIIQWQPGTGKTKFVHILASLCDLSYARIQCTPDMMPQDVLWIEVFDPQQKTFVFHPWPIMANIVHVDEINRATPKLQSAFLQAMQESHLSIGNSHIDLPSPFFLLATQNPYDSVWTYSLPYAQIDRFMVGSYTTSLDMKGEYALLHPRHIAPATAPVVTKPDIEKMQWEVAAIHVDDELLQHCVQCIDTIRAYNIPISTRATKAIVDAAKALAYMQGKTSVEKLDIDRVLLSVCKHRVAHFLWQSVSNESLYRIISWAAQKDDIVMQ
jgi:MoxR-like ATPase